MFFFPLVVCTDSDRPWPVAAVASLLRVLHGVDSFPAAGQPGTMLTHILHTVGGGKGGTPQLRSARVQRQIQD